MPVHVSGAVNLATELANPVFFGFIAVLATVSAEYITGCSVIVFLISLVEEIFKHVDLGFGYVWAVLFWINGEKIVAFHFDWDCRLVSLGG